jgi:hypothetical protein
MNFSIFKSSILIAFFIFVACNLLIAETIYFKPSDTKKKEENVRTEIVYEVVSSTPKADAEIARRKARKPYNIKGMPDYDILEDTMTKAQYLTTKEFEYLMPLGEDKVLYITRNELCWDGEVKNKDITGNDNEVEENIEMACDLQYPNEAVILSKTGNQIKKLDIGGYITDARTSNSGDFFIFKEYSRDLSSYVPLEDLLNPSYFSSRNGLIAFDGNGNKLWEQEFPEDEEIKEFEVSDKGYAFVRTKRNRETKRFFYTKTGEKRDCKYTVWNGRFLRDGLHFLHESNGHDAFLINAETMKQIHLGFRNYNIIPADISSWQAGIAIAANRGFLKIVNTHTGGMIANIDFNNEYYRFRAEEYKEGMKEPISSIEREVFISEDGTEIKILCDNDYVFMFKRKESNK